MKSCRKVAEQLAYKDDLNPIERVMLKIHLFMCQKCARVSKQMDHLDESVQRLVDQETQEKDAAIKKIKDKAKKNLSL